MPYVDHELPSRWAREGYLTLSEVAQTLGCSTGVISNLLRRDPDIAAASRLDHGYRLVPAADVARRLRRPDAAHLLSARLRELSAGDPSGPTD